MSKAKYPNRDALREANDVYLDAMYQFVSKCLDKVQSTTAGKLIEEKIEISDIAHLVRTYWYDSFEAHFDAIDPYYEARSAVGLIVEGRNRTSHPPWDLEPEFTRTQLFLIAEVLGKINKLDEQREVEAIRDKLFNDTAEQLVTIAVEDEKAKYEKSITKVEKRLAAEKENNEELSKQIVDNAAKLDEKTEELEKLSGRLVTAKLGKKESEKRLNSTSKQLEKVQAVHSACEKHITTISDQVTSTEAERDDYKERLETSSEELKEVNERLSITSGQLLAVKAERDVSEERLAATRRLLTTATIGSQEVRAIFPPFETDSTVRILDRRGKNKQDYLLNLLEQKQPAIIYVQSEEMVNLLLKRVVPEKANFIEKHGEQTSEAEEAEILEKLENRELIAVVSNTTFSALDSSHCIEHFVFCHLAPGIDEFFKLCQPAFTSAKNAYLHLIYESKQNIEDLTEKYPNEEALRKLYQKFKNLTSVEEKFFNSENLYSELCKDSELDMTKLGIETGFSIFRELGFLEQNEEGIRRLSTNPRKLEESKIYCRGEKLKEEIANSPAFQYEQSIEQIWEGILEKLGVDSEQILRERNIHETSSDVSGMDGDVQSSKQTEQDSRTPTTDNAGAQETSTPFDASQQHAYKVVDDTGGTLIKESDAEFYSPCGDTGNADDSDSAVQAEQSTEAVDSDSTVDDETVETSPTPKPVRANAKVTEEQVREIRARRKAGESYSKLAKEFGLTPTGIRNIALGNTWKHVK